MLLTYLFLLMAAIQEISARIGRATRYGRRRECLPMAADFCDLKDGEIVAIGAAVRSASSLSKAPFSSASEWFVLVPLPPFQ